MNQVYAISAHFRQIYFKIIRMLLISCFLSLHSSTYS